MLNAALFPGVSSSGESSDDDSDFDKRLELPTSSSTSLDLPDGSSTDGIAESEFRNEVRLSLECAFTEGHSVDNAAVELKTLRMATNVSLSFLWLDPISSRYHRLNKGGCVTSSACTAVRWVPASASLFLVSHADGTIVVYDRDREDGTFGPREPVGNNVSSLAVRATSRSSLGFFLRRSPPPPPPTDLFDDTNTDKPHEEGELGLAHSLSRCFNNDIVVVVVICVYYPSIQDPLPTAIAFLPKHLLTSTKNGLVKLWVRPLALKVGATSRAGR
ncbi:hypothetical protein GGU11DRAFT_850892 [Lentinula aff. detonsa]|nr:hypothetical protein GGU11DRAFT_850892 [Lentinula aff. detonsa]